jgi:hypothetical protein
MRLKHYTRLIGVLLKPSSYEFNFASNNGLQGTLALSRHRPTAPEPERYHWKKEFCPISPPPSGRFKALALGSKH